MNYNQYQPNYSPSGYPATQQAFSNIAMNPYASSPSGTSGSYPHSSYPQSTQQQGGSTTAQSNASPSQLSSHAYNYAPYGGSSASYTPSNYPISSQYAQTNAHMNSHASSYQPMPQQQPTYQPPSGQSLMTQMNNNQGLVLPKATTPRAGPTKRRRASEDTPKPVKPVPINESDNWERGKYQPTVRKRAKKNFADDEEDDDDIDDDIEEDDDDEMLQRTERKSSRERKPSAKKGGEKETKKSSSSVSASPRVTPKKKEEKVEEEEEDIEVEEQGNLEVELEFPEDGLTETDEETHTKKYNKIIFNGNTYVVGDTIAFWPEGKKRTSSNGYY
jgi:hypothetical protein